jgi:DNA-directed RNA polymerase subunit RPC12/RpoP
MEKKTVSRCVHCGKPAERNPRDYRTVFCADCRARIYARMVCVPVSR